MLALTAARRMEVAPGASLHGGVCARRVCVGAVRGADGSLVRERDGRAVTCRRLWVRRVALLMLLLHIRLMWVDLRSRLALLRQLRLLRLALLRELMWRH